VSETSYRIEFTIQRRCEGEDDYAEIGFGSSSSCGDVDAALYEVQSMVQNRQWETELGMPDPREVCASDA
jgi:hypothetical protein